MALSNKFTPSRAIVPVLREAIVLPTSSSRNSVHLTRHKSAPEIRSLLHADDPTLIGLFNRGLIGLTDGIVAGLDLAVYGIDVTSVVATEGMVRIGWMEQNSAARLRRDLRMLNLVLAAEGGRSPARLLSETRAA